MKSTKDKQDICSEVLVLDKSIRFVGLANRLGRLVDSAYRPGLMPLLKKAETEQYAVQAATRMLTRESFEPKLGKLRHAIGTYDRLIRATIALPSNDIDHPNFLLVSFDPGADATAIVENKILPLMKGI